MPKPSLYRGLTLISVMLLSASAAAAMVMENYRQGMDQTWGTQSQKIVVTEKEGAANTWTYKSKFQSAKAAVEGLKELAMRQAAESFVLLKNANGALPLTQAAPKVTLMGLRSFAAVYGNSGGSIADKDTIDEEKTTIVDSFLSEGMDLNPSILAAYREHFKEVKWGGSGFGATPPEYEGYASADKIPELTPAELAALNGDYNKDYASYHDAAIVVLGRPGGEAKNFRTGSKGIADGSVTTTGNILGLSEKEKAIIQEAKDNFDKVIVLINSTQAMEIKELKDDPDIDAIMWIGYPGAYGFRSLAQVLKGAIAPSGRLGETLVSNGVTAPAMQNFGDDTPWINKSEFEAGANVNSYLIQAEGIYAGYRYYETRYADIVNGVAKAEDAKAGTYTTGNGVLADAAGKWNYGQEVVYPFGAGLSYTTFSERFDSVNVKGDKRTAEVKVTVTNTGSVPAKHAVGLYASAPYTAYDKENGVEKSAIQLLDFEKTKQLEAGQAETLTFNVDMANIASYDAKGKKTFIVEGGEYRFALGTDVHDALNNVLKAQGKDVQGDASLTRAWTWEGGVDDKTFSVSDNGVTITNRLSEGDYAMDLNAFQPNTVTYLSRSDWDGTFPKTYANLAATGRIAELIDCDFIDIKPGDVSAFRWGVKNGLTIRDFQNAAWDDPRWQSLIDQVTPEEFLAFASNAFHHLAKIDSVGLIDYDTDDGPGGSDTHRLKEGHYQGKAWEDADSVGNKGTRVTPSQTNLAYTWNKELAYENGEVILGESSLCLNLPIMIGPAMNLKRHGYNGRGGEYLSEDPILSGYIGSNIVQGAQSKGCLVNIKHAAFNDQEINRAGIAVFMNEQKARELELRNLNQAFAAKGKPASFLADASKENTFKQGALGVMTSYNRIGAVPSSSNKAVMVDIMREEWGFKGYNVTDFTGVNLRAAPKESILFGTTAFCGFGAPSLDYWSVDAATREIRQTLSSDPAFAAAIKQDVKYALYAVCHSNVLNNVNVTLTTVQQMTSWRAMYISMISVSAALTVGLFTTSLVLSLRKRKEI